MATKKEIKPKAYSLLCASYDVAYKNDKNTYVSEN